MTPPTTLDQSSVRTAGAWLPWILVMVFFSLTVAMAVAFLASVSGANAPETVLTGGSAFAGTMGLCLGVVSAIKKLQKIT